MKQYLDIVRNVMENGHLKGNRTGVRAKTTFCEVFRHNMADGFPLLTTKKTYMHGIAVELEGFLNGITSKGWYQERRCKIWNEWANPKSVESMKAELKEAHPTKEDYSTEMVQEIANDLGPIYGYQWRNFDEHYPVQWDAGPEDFGDRASLDWPVNGIEKGCDQLKNVINTLKTNPDDRRMVISAWNPNQIHLMALPPCHYAFTLVHINGVLNLCWKQRSCDLMLGVPFNIASYALLLELICKESGLIPGELVGILEDCHIYEDKMKGAVQQLERDPRRLPTITIPYGGFDIFNWTHEDYSLNNYDPHPKIDFGKVAV